MMQAAIAGMAIDAKKYEPRPGLLKPRPGLVAPLTHEALLHPLASRGDTRAGYNPGQASNLNGRVC